MSLLNAYIEPETALVAVDTAMTGHGLSGEVSKLLPIVHMPAIIAGRGAISIIMNLAPQALGATAGFDALAEAIPELLRDVRARVLAAQPDALGGGGHEILAVGWSARHGRLVGHDYRLAADGQVEARIVVGEHVAPWDDAEPDGPIPRDVPSMIELAEAQRDLLRRHEMPDACGGRLIAATVSRDTVAAKVVHEFSEG